MIIDKKTWSRQKLEKEGVIKLKNWTILSIGPEQQVGALTVNWEWPIEVIHYCMKT